MSAIYGRARSTEAPMTGIEFTNRANMVPAWRVNSASAPTASSSSQVSTVDSSISNGGIKRTHSTAHPPPTPFDPKNANIQHSRPIFGENLRYLFKPPHLAQQSQQLSAPPSSYPPQEIPDVIMREAEQSPQRPHERSGRARPDDNKENERARLGSESPERRVISNAAVRRLARKQNGELTGRSRRYRGRGQKHGDDEDEEEYNSDEYDEDGSPRKKSLAVTRNTSNHYTLNMPGPAPVKTDTPYILLGYLQFIFNLSLILLFLYLLVQFIVTVQRDVEQRVGEYSQDILQEITTCATLYKTNLCATTPIPALMQQCATWETCMTRDPSVVGRAKVGAQMLGEVMDSFVESISWKTWLFSISSLAFVTAFVNGFVNLYRSRLLSSSQQGSSQPDRYQNPHPNFPHAPYGYLPMNMGMGLGMPYPPQQHSMGGLSWHPDNEVEGLPRQRRRLENGDAPVETEG